MGLTLEEWDIELAALVPGQPPLDGRPGKVMVIVHPKDRAALEVLRNAFDRSIVLDHLKYDGTQALPTFYGER